MEKNWLIRTKSNHILGPISKDKILELYNNGSIKPDDEICSGNGYWFFIREDDLVKRFLLGSEQQGFNPISEAKNVLNQLPPKNENQDDITKVGGIDLNKLRKEENDSASSSVSNTIDTPPPALSLTTENLAENAELKKKDKVENINTSSKKISPESNKQIYIKYLTWVGIILFILLIYYRKTVIKSFLKSSTFNLIDSAIAQEMTEAKKKT